jgi:carbon-monoxide dehydrogenase medium subunit
VQSYTYHRAASLVAACRLLEQLPQAQILAGGTDLVVDLEVGLRQAEHVVSIRDITELAKIERLDDHVVIGAGCPASAVERSDVVRKHLPELADMVVKFASPQIRNSATLAGNICSAVACGDFPPILIALRARVELASSEGMRIVELEDFFLGNRETVRKPGELIARILIPLKPDGAAASYQKFRRRAANSLGVASVAAYIEMAGGTCRDARIVLGAVAPVPLLTTKASQSLLDTTVDEAAIATAAKLARQEARPITDLRASDDYRRKLVEVLTTRALRAALAAITGEGAR